VVVRGHSLSRLSVRRREFLHFRARLLIMRENNAFMPVSQLELGHRAMQKKLRVQCERYGYLMSRIWSCWDGQCLLVFGI
jgi:hypothetical protein